LRKIVALVASAVLLASGLTGCSSAAQNLDDALFTGLKNQCAPLVTGSTADQISVTEKKSGKPTVKFPTPLRATVTQSKIVKEGTGPVFTGNQLINFEYQGYNARTGKLFQSSAWNGTDNASEVLAKPTANGGADFCHALTGAREGSIVAVAMSPKDSHGSQPIAQIGVRKNDSLVFVFKIKKIFLPRANGKAQAAQNGFPQIVTDASGVPGVVLQDWSKPAFTKFASETLIQGFGPVLKKNDWVTVHYSGFVWSSSKTKFDSSWDKNTPAQFQLKDGQLIPGFIKALVGQKVGSQVVAVLPPDEAYGQQESGSIPANSTLIFVIDILGVGK